MATVTISVVETALIEEVLVDFTHTKTDNPKNPSSSDSRKCPRCCLVTSYDEATVDLKGLSCIECYERDPYTVGKED